MLSLQAITERQATPDRWQVTGKLPAIENIKSRPPRRAGGKVFYGIERMNYLSSPSFLSL